MMTGAPPFLKEATLARELATAPLSSFSCGLDLIDSAMDVLAAGLGADEAVYVVLSASEIMREVLNALEYVNC